MTTPPEFLRSDLVNQCYDTATKAIPWMLSWQGKDGGLSPYPPEFERSPYVRDSGVLGTSDCILSLTRAFASSPTILDSYWKFLECTRIASKRIKEREPQTLVRCLQDAVNFLVNSQLPDGGHPPLGDIYGVRDISFTEATADAILALFSSLRCLQNIFSERSREKEYEVKNSIQNGITWLLFSGIHAEVGGRKYTWWNTGIDFPKNEVRFFPSILASISLNLYIERSKELSFDDQERISFDTLSDYLRGVVDLYCYLLREKKFLPFKLSASDIPEMKYERISFTCTSMAISFLLSTIHNNTSIDVSSRDNEIIEICGGAIDYLKDRRKEWEETDDDEIQLYPLRYKDRSVTGSYLATYLRRPSILACELDFLPYYRDSNQETIFKKGLVEEVELLIGDSNPGGFLCEKRSGEKTAAMSATAIATMLLRRLIELSGRAYA